MRSYTLLENDPSLPDDDNEGHIVSGRLMRRDLPVVRREDTNKWGHRSQVC